MQPQDTTLQRLELGPTVIHCKLNSYQEPANSTATIASRLQATRLSNQSYKIF